MRQPRTVHLNPILPKEYIVSMFLLFNIQNIDEYTDRSNQTIFQLNGFQP